MSRTTKPFSSWEKQIQEVSNINKAIYNTKKYLGMNAKLYASERQYKKYKIYNPNTNKYVHFGDIRYQDFTKHGDKIRQNNYLKRATNIKGDWKNNKYSPNSLSINILWK
jgi:hypothetical protein